MADTAPSPVSQAVTREHPRGVLVLVLGILGLLGPVVASPVAWYLGAQAQREIDAAPSEFTNRSMVVAGKVLGIIGTVLLGLVALALVAAGLALVVAGVGSGALRTDGSALVFVLGVLAVLVVFGFVLSLD